MMELGLWSQFKFTQQQHTPEMIDLLTITALKSKKLCNELEEYHIYQEFVFHNSEVMNSNAEQTMTAAEKKRETKARQKLTLREKFFKWEEEVFKNEL